MLKSNHILLLLICIMVSNCSLSYQVAKDKQVYTHSVVTNSDISKITNPDSSIIAVAQAENRTDGNPPLINMNPGTNEYEYTHGSHHGFRFLPDREASSNISNFNPLNQNLCLSVWNKGNENLAFLHLGEYISQDSFEIEGYVTNRNKNEKIYVSKKFSVRDFNSISLDNLGEGQNNYRINTNRDTSDLKDAATDIMVMNLFSYSMANGNIKTYRGIYLERDTEYEFIAQTDPIPLLIIIAGVAVASSATTLLIRDPDPEDDFIVENKSAYQECIAGGGTAKMELINNRLFSPDVYRFRSCE